MLSQKILWILLAAILVSKAFAVPTATEKIIVDDEDDEDFDDEDESSEADDDGRIYKNPRNSPSVDCPRDEEQATLLGQKCLRKCSSDEDCKSKKKKCLCDGACGMSCIKPDRECPELAKPSLGLVDISGRHFGNRATYSCPTGYNVVGLQSRLCQADGSWAGAEPACKQDIFCLIPPTIEHARHSAFPEQATFDLDSTVQYHCHTGYVTNGFPRAKCLAIDGQASWYGPDIQCEPRSCGQPPDPGNGWHAGECYTYGCRVLYQCGSGYEIVGKAERYCQADGSWVPKELPTCVLVISVVCPTPENPKNGKAIYTTLSYNSVVSYECRYGYTLVGDSSRRCGADRKWSGSLPTCKEINCGHPGVLYNGWLENLEGGTGLGASIIFRCQPEMMLIGNSSTVCQIDGRWRYPAPECLAPCIVPTISQGHVIPIELITDDNTTIATTPTVITSVGKVKHGTALEVNCDQYYEFPVSSLSPPTCNNGTWSTIPRCVPARCKNMPRAPKHGMVLAPKTEHGMKARFKCKDGWKLTDRAGKEITDTEQYVLTCSFGNWTGDTPYCTEVYCSFPGFVLNGKVLLVGNMGLYDYRPYVKKIVNNKQIMYECEKGYVMEEGGAPGATCIGGKWRPTDVPKCYLGQHPRLRWSRRRRSLEVRYLRSKLFFDNVRRLQNYLNECENPAEEIKTRRKRSPMDLETAYTQYFEKIKKKYRNYVKNLLGYSRFRTPQLPQPHEGASKRDHQESRYQKPNRQRPSGNEYTSIDDSLNGTESQLLKVPIPNINDDSAVFITSTKAPHVNLLSAQILRQGESSRHNISSLIEQLKSQVVRKKRDSDDDGLDDGKKGKPRGPCEELDWDSFGNYTILRPGKLPGRNTAGTMIAINCNPGFRLTMKNHNNTFRCVRGIWKPNKPECISAPCIVPSSSNGKYFEVALNPAEIQETPEVKSLNSYQEVESGQSITFQCDDGYTIQGAVQMRCLHGSWSVNQFPECVSLPCTLPNLVNAIYEGGYRAGLTIAHGSTVNVHCDNTVNSTPVKISCVKGALAPAIETIHCETGQRKSRGEEYLIEAEFVDSEQPFTNGKKHKILDMSSEENRNSSQISENEVEDSCGPPDRVDGAITYMNGEPFDPDVGFESGTEIFFNCIESKAGERNTWKIRCEDGDWIGRAYACENGTCLFRNNEPNVVSFYNDLEIREDTVEFPPGATIISRCVDIGKFELIGSNERTCIHSEWTGIKPICNGLNQENDYAMEKNPTILFRHQDGPIAQSNDGKLIVYPGTTVHMECLWMKKFGNPKWNVSHEYRVYPEKWVSADEPGRDPNLEYRLSIISATEDDSGTFTCLTPSRHEHSVEIVVKAIHCVEIPERRGLIVNSNDTKMGTKVHLSCANGNSLIGASELLCLPSGNWSAPLPVCESVECGDIPISPNEVNPAGILRIAVLSREVGGRASFTCPSGFGLRGPSESVCLPTGEWQTPFPQCIEVQCDNPGAPHNGYFQGSPPYRAGDVVQFNCNPEYMMQGQPIIACQDSGRWSGGLPKCVQACSYPGTTISGRMSSVKFYYAIGESITFTCDAGLELRGAKMLKCLKNGKWSNAIPTCVSLNSALEANNTVSSPYKNTQNILG